MLLDEVKIYVRSGDGGDGIVAFLREKFMPRGGPAGGDGGRGGDVVIKVNPRLNTLSPFQRGVHFKADNGKPGRAKNMSGASGKVIEIDVPPGTVIKDPETGAIIADLVRKDDRVVIAKGGRGGRGNQHFASPSNQTPRMAEKGAPGQEMWLTLELKLIADVGLVGVPNAGKSTLLSVISNARPKIADYPFTTLEPNLGVVLYDQRDMVVADIPGLIEGAHLGVGLGHSFLRHVQRTRVLVHLLNGASENPIADYSQINSELALYDERLGEKPQIVVFTKMDLPEAQERWPEVKAFLNARGIEPMAISAATQQNVKELIQRVFLTVDALPPVEIMPVEITPLYELPEEEVVFNIVREDNGAYRVVGRRIERAASMTHWDYEDAVMRFQDILETLGVSAALVEAGVQVGDTVYIGDYELEWAD
ncbi:MAG: GTPase ObgE [Chloroflexi bacterium]|nr:GTPase ObgE [Chloroflexota bacterium]MCC6896356.1 GTPase ObgE [Anaerolineae bacterium]